MDTKLILRSLLYCLAGFLPWLANGQTFSGNNAPGNSSTFNFTVGAGAANLSVTLPGSAAGYSHVLLKKGAAPTDTNFDFISQLTAQTNSIHLESPEFTPATYYATVRTPIGAPAHAFTLTVETNRSDLRSVRPVSKSLSFTNSGALPAGTWNYFRVEVPTNATALKVLIESSATSPDLYIQRGQLPTTASFLKRSTNVISDVLLLADTEATAGAYFIGVFAPAAGGLANYTIRTEVLSLGTLNFDSGATHEGTDVFSTQTTGNTDTYFKIRTGSPAVGAWRTALKVQSGEAHVYLSRGTLPTKDSFGFKSERAGSDGIVLGTTDFSAGEDWYILVRALGDAQWSIVSGAAYVMDLGELASDASSSTNVVVGPEGWRFFKTSIPANTLAWRLWLSDTNGLTTTNSILVRKSSVGLMGSSELIGAGQMLAVPPYLAVGQLYVISVQGSPGDAVNLDSRQQQIHDISFTSSTNLNYSGYGYSTYRVQIPANEIAWQISLVPGAGNPNLYVRRNLVPNENNNEALSEVTGSVADSISLVPPILSDGTFYITVIATNTNSFTLQSGPPTVTDINYVDTITNNETNRAGWRYYRVANIEQQLGSLGWDLYLTNAPPGTRIALRKSRAPSTVNFRNPTTGTINSYDFFSTGDFLQRPGHQADIWYIGIYNPSSALGNFTLFTRELNAPLLVETELPGGSQGGIGTNCNLSGTLRTNVAPLKWEFFRVDVPVDVAGWDVRVVNVTAGAPKVAIKLGGLPTTEISSSVVTTNIRNTISSPGVATNWANGLQWASGVDWTKRQFSAEGADENGRVVALGTGRPLVPGITYYVGVFNASTNAATYELVNRFIGTGKSIPVVSLPFSGGIASNSVCPREAAYYKISIPNGTPSWKVRLTVVEGEAMLVASTNKIPNVESEKRVQKLGKEHYLLLPDEGQAFLKPGDHYLAVIGEGMAPTSNNRVGTGKASYVLESVGTLPIINLGTLQDELWHTNQMDGGETVAYQFMGIEGSLGYEATIEPEYGNPTMVVRSTSALPDPGVADGFPADPYGNEGGEKEPETLAVSTYKVFASGISPIETILVKARARTNTFPDARFTLRVKKFTATPLSFDGGTEMIANQTDLTWRFFEVDVPTNALGWDIRLTNVVSGFPQLVVCREAVPVHTSTSTGFNPAVSTNWPYFARWAADSDWTGRSLSADGNVEDWRILAMGMRRPLEASKYYVGVFADISSSYTIMSRAIGTNMSIPVQDLAFSGGSITATRPAREAAYFKVTVPTNTPSWKVRLSGASSADEMTLIALRDTIPSVLASGALSSTNLLSAGRKMQKLGEEHFLLLPYPGTTNLLAGDYYLAVVSEGGSPSSNDRVGEGPSTFTLTSFGVQPFVDLGTLEGGVDLVQAGEARAGESIAYRFTVPAGTLSMEARLQNRVGNPVMVTRESPRLPDPGMLYSGSTADPYGNEGGDLVGTFVNPSLITVPNPTAGLHYLFVKARMTNSVHTNASYTLRLTANNSALVDFDGGTSVVTNQAAGTWRYFRIQVPTNALGWDIRLSDVLAGSPRMVVRRDVLPSGLTTGPWSAPGNTFSWSSSNQWVAAEDWTERQFSPTGTIDEEGRILAMGMGRPLQPGLYYVGVLNKTGVTNAMSYTVRSRGIGNDLSIPVYDVPFEGGTVSNISALAREAAYFRVIVPSNSPSWKVKISGTAGEFMAVGLQNYIPNLNYLDENFTMVAGKSLQKAGNEHYVALPVSPATTIPGGTNYFAVVSEGANPSATDRVGNGGSTFSVTSIGSLPITDLGVVSSTELGMVDSLEGGESKAYQFTVPAGSRGVEVKLDSRVGNPVLTLRAGTSLPNPGGTAGSVTTADYYGNDGGYTATDAHPVLLTLPNPVPGTYSLMIKSRPQNKVFSDATYRLRVREVLTPQLNFTASFNTNGLTNSVSGLLEDNQRAFFIVNVPPIAENTPLGWKLELRQSSGLASVRVRKDALPSDNPATGTPFVSPAAYIAPAYLTEGLWYVEVKGSNSTAFTLTSSAIELERPTWTMPEVGKTNSAPGLSYPFIGDTGIDTNGNSIGGDESLFLDQGYQHYYSVWIPTNNGGLLRLQLEAISGNPDLYARMASIPTVSHNATGGSGTTIDRGMTAAIGTEYANWVPLSGRSETALKPGHWFLMVRAAGNANARYRLRTSVGNVQDINLSGESLSNQIVANNDWRYYRFTVPSATALGWQVSFTQQSGDVWMYVRDTVPPGNGISLTDPYRHWNHAGDQKNNGPYPDFNNPGTYTFTTPPTRPGHVYYLGFRAIGDSTFSVSITTNGAPLAELPEIPFYGGSINTMIPGLSQVTYAIDVPADAVRWKHTSTHTTNLSLYIEQGTLPSRAATDDLRSSAANFSGNQYLLNALPAAWPWVPSQRYYLTISNRVGAAEAVTFTMDGRNATTDDDENDGMPDAWERLYFGNTSQSANADPDGDGVSNLIEYQEGTIPTDNTSYRPRLTTSGTFGSIGRDPNLPSYPINSTVTLTAQPNAGYAFVTWSNAVTNALNPLPLVMNGHKNISAIFKVIGDDFSIAVPFAASPTTGVNIGATKESGEPNHGGNPGGKSVWWKWTAPASGPVTVDTAGSSFNTLLGVYSGTTVSNLTTIAGASTTGTNKAKVTFNAASGGLYYFGVDGVSAASGTVNLSVTATTPPTPLLMLSPVWSNSFFRFTLQGEPNQRYTVYVSSNLTQWNSLFAVTNSPQGTLQVTDTTSTNTGNRYYRFGTP